jgi:hypothetical protein
VEGVDIAPARDDARRVTSAPRHPADARETAPRSRATLREMATYRSPDVAASEVVLVPGGLAHAAWLVLVPLAVTALAFATAMGHACLRGPSRVVVSCEPDAYEPRVVCVRDEEDPVVIDANDLIDVRHARSRWGDTTLACQGLPHGKACVVPEQMRDEIIAALNGQQREPFRRNFRVEPDAGSALLAVLGVAGAILASAAFATGRPRAWRYVIDAARGELRVHDGPRAVTLAFTRGDEVVGGAIIAARLDRSATKVPAPWWHREVEGLSRALTEKMA